MKLELPKYVADERAAVRCLRLGFCFLCLLGGWQRTAQGQRNDAGEVVSTRFYGKPGELADAVRDFSNLQALEIAYYTTLNQEDIDAIAKLTSLTELYLGQEAALGETVSLKGSLDSLSSLKSLEFLRVAVDGFDEREWDFLRKLPKLESVEVDVSRYFDTGKENLLTDEFGTTLGAMKALRDLSVRGADRLTDSFVANLVSRNDEMVALRLTEGSFTDQSLSLLAHRCPDLQCLEIESSQLTDVAIEHLASLQRLKRLTVYSPRLTGSCTKSISAIESLEVVDLNIKSASPSDLKQLARLPNLIRLILRHVTFHDDGLKHFFGHGRLESLFCNGRHLSKQTALQFVRSLPNVDYISFGSRNTTLQVEIEKEVKRRVALREGQAK